MSEPWTEGVAAPRVVRTGFPEVQEHSKWPHEYEGVAIPMPAGERLAAMEREDYQRVEGGEIGPVTSAWVKDTFAWAKRLKKEFFGEGKQVTGLWAKARNRFRRRLGFLQEEPESVRARVLDEVSHGVSLPFENEPANPVVSTKNHPDLGLRAGHVYDALCMQLEEGSILPFDVSRGEKPMGVLSLRWVEKSNPDEVRLTLNGRPLNEFFPAAECTLVLETHRELRSNYRRGQRFLGFDLHNGFFNQQYRPSYRKWVCFRIHDSELLPTHVRALRERFPTSWVGGFVYFSYRGLVMGLSPSCQQLSRVNVAMLKVWRRFKVAGAVWDGTTFIDDLMVWTSGTYSGALELGLHLLAEQVILGYSVNLNYKSVIVPHTRYCHIGVVISSSRMRFSLPIKRVEKIEKTARELWSQVQVGKPVSAKLVARFVGQLWAASIVCFRAVALLARGMIRTLAMLINTSEAMNESDPNRLRYILRRVWGGKVIWTAEAHQELRFWLGIEFATLSSPISVDAWQASVNAVVLDPKTGKLADDVKVFAVDTSDSMSGGGEFLRDGCLWRLVRGMAVRLHPQEIATSSTYRELLGVFRLDLAIVPASCLKAVVVLDSQAAVACLLKGSKVKLLQDLVRKIFARQLKFGRVLWPVWVRRSRAIIVQCDERSRWVDNFAFTMAAKVFWRANDIAISLWGRGFQVDTCADMHNVQPTNRAHKLPFYSRWLSPHASATDMLQQNWTKLVNWCNPPFVLVPRIFALLQMQRAAAAVVAPWDVHERWFAVLGAHKQRVLHVEPVQLKRGRRHAIFFVDFRQNPLSRAFDSLPSAESFPLTNSRVPVYHSLRP